MPLSEHEQKILAELEESLSKQDPRFAKNVRETNVYSHGGDVYKRQVCNTAHACQHDRVLNVE